jgi:hypothetical protein
MPSFRTVSIAAITGTFMLVGFGWWLAKGTAEVGTPHAEPARTTQQLPPNTVRTGRVIERAQGGQAAAPIVAKAAGLPVDAEKGSAVPAAPQLPLLVHFYRRMRDPDRRIEGSIENTSNDNFVITLNVVSAATHAVSRSTLDVASQSRVVFGRDDGLNLGLGDQVTLQAPTYGDLVQEIQRVQ